MAESIVEFAQLTRSRRIGYGDECRRNLIDLDGSLFAARAPNVVNVLVVHYGEEPSTKVRAHLPEMSLSQPAQECVLHEIIRPIAVPRERSRVATEARDRLVD